MVRADPNSEGFGFDSRLELTANFSSLAQNVSSKSYTYKIESDRLKKIVLFLSF